MTELLAEIVEEAGDAGDKVAITVGEVVVDFFLGMVVVIGVLAILVGLLYVVRFAIQAIERPKKAKATETPKANAAPLPVTDEDEEVVAAITAAITCILSEEANGETVVAPFRIKKIKQIR